MDNNYKKSRVTEELIGLLLYGIYTKIKAGGKFSLNGTIEQLNLPSSQISMCLKECKILENTGEGGRSAEWRWIPQGMPNDVMIKKVFDTYQTSLSDFRKKRDAYKGINRGESGQPIIQPNQSIWVRERIELMEKEVKWQTELLTTLLLNMGITKTHLNNEIE